MNIAVLAGGYSPERDVSLTSGSLIANALIDEGHNVCLADVYLGIRDELLNEKTPFNKDKKPIYKVEHTVPDLVTLKEQSGNGEALIGHEVGKVREVLALHCKHREGSLAGGYLAVELIVYVEGDILIRENSDRLIES